MGGTGTTVNILTETSGSGLVTLTIDAVNLLAGKSWFIASPKELTSLGANPAPEAEGKISTLPFAWLWFSLKFNEVFPTAPVTTLVVVSIAVLRSDIKPLVEVS